MYVYLMPEKGLKTKKVSEDYGMLTIKTQIANAILTALPEGSGLVANEILDMLEYPPDASMGDLALPCFKLSRTLRRAPVQIAASLAEALFLEKCAGLTPEIAVNEKILATATEIKRIGGNYYF